MFPLFLFLSLYLSLNLLKVSKERVFVARPPRHVGDHEGAWDSGGHLPQLQLFWESPREQDAKREKEESKRHVNPHQPWPKDRGMVTQMSLPS